LNKKQKYKILEKEKKSLLRRLWVWGLNLNAKEELEENIAY
jgi:hypothetical protein